jgi:hypothetical protein
MDQERREIAAWWRPPFSRNARVMRDFTKSLTDGYNLGNARFEVCTVDRSMRPK